MAIGPKIDLLVNLSEHQPLFSSHTCYWKMAVTQALSSVFRAHQYTWPFSVSCYHPHPHTQCTYWNTGLPKSWLFVHFPPTIGLLRQEFILKTFFFLPLERIGGESDLSPFFRSLKSVQWATQYILLRLLKSIFFPIQYIITVKIYANIAKNKECRKWKPPIILSSRENPVKCLSICAKNPWLFLEISLNLEETINCSLFPRILLPLSFVRWNQLLLTLC